MRLACSRWDRDTTALLPLARETGLDGMEVVTPKPQGDVTLEEVRAVLPDGMLLLDGVPAILFDETFGVEEFLACVRKVVELFAPQPVLGISEEISSSGRIGRLLPIRDIVEEYNAGPRGARAPKGPATGGRQASDAGSGASPERRKREVERCAESGPSVLDVAEADDPTAQSEPASVTDREMRTKGQAEV